MRVEMKKSTNTSSMEHSRFIGKSYQLSKHQVVIEEVIAEGGFSIVFLAKSTHNGKKYALKRMCVNNEHDLEACRLEIQIIKKFSENNRHILRYVDSSIHRQTQEIYEILLLSKYCRSGGLVQLMNERLGQNSRFQEAEIVKILCDTCQALADLHASDIIHRDLKVENILIDQEANVKHPSFGQLIFVLCDFGSATKNIFDKKQHTSSHSIQVVADEIQKYTTLSYRSPEMVDLYSNKLITTKSDIWALGVFLYKLCYFQMPFGESQLAIQEGRYFIPNAKVAFYSKQLNQLINYMLDPEPSKRPDIYQVSYLAFQLAQKPCPIKNLNKSEIPNFSAIAMPMTENEWKKSSSMAVKKTINTPVQEQSTTVNPRERPKAHLNHTNNILQLPNQNIIKTKPNNNVGQQKLNVSIKPKSENENSPFALSTNNQEPLGFDDDFGSINPIADQSDKLTQQTPVLETKKTHRRSASHSSTLFPQFNMNTPSGSQVNMRLTPTQYSLQINPSEQQAKNQYLLHQQSNMTPVSAQVLDRIYTHSRSASASPNTNNLASLKIDKPIEEERRVSNNPFDDNELFGQEFDRIRQETTVQEKALTKSSKKSAIVKYSSIDEKENENGLLFDPFRKAPLSLFNANMSPSSSGSCSPKSSTSSNETCKKVTIGTHSAFQPYKKQPDPFVSAPFDTPINRKVSLSSTSTSSSVTPTGIFVQNTAKTNSNLECLNELEAKANDEIVQVIQMKDKLSVKTPISHKKKTTTNPFVDAPFTVKKSKGHARKKLSELTQMSESSASSLYDNNPTPTNDFKPVQASSQNETKSITTGISNMSFDDF